MNSFDRVILSCDANPKYVDFWPVVCRAWEKLFGVQPVLAFVGSYEDQCACRGKLQCGPVIYIRPVEGIPLANQAKLARYWLAAWVNDEKTTMINDIDLLPLSKDYVNTLLGNRPKGTLLTVGSELYIGPEKGKAMAGYLTAESSVFKKLVNPKALSFSDWMSSFVGLSCFDHKEDVMNSTSTDSPDCFSDESLLRYWHSVNPVPREDRRMPFWPYIEQALDRFDWKFDVQKLKDGVYKEAHLPRPYSQNRDKIQPLVDYIEAQ